MALTSADLEGSPYLRALVLAGAKAGKTYTCVRTCEKPVLVLNSDDKHSLRTAGAGMSASEFMWLPFWGDNEQKVEDAIAETRELVAKGKVKTVIWDTVTMYCERSLERYVKKNQTVNGKDNGLKHWYDQRKHVLNVLQRLMALECHLIVTSHFVEQSGATIDGQLDKMGSGIVPGIEGGLRMLLPARFQDVVYLDKTGDKRIFICAAEGIWGPGCRSLPGVKTVAADIQKLWKLMLTNGAEVTPIEAAASAKKVVGGNAIASVVTKQVTASNQKPTIKK